MSLQGPEKKDLVSTGETHQLPETRTGTIGDRQVVVYDSRTATQSPLERMAQIFQARCSQLLRRSLESNRYATQHLHQYGEGKIFVLLGNSTAGKTSIVRQLMRDALEFTESGMDMDFPLQDAAAIQEKAPELYGRMARAMEPKFISFAVMWGDEPHWKSGVTEAQLKDAQDALQEVRKMGFDVVSQDADAVRTKTPELYARMAQAMEHRDIARALFGDEVHWKPGITQLELKDAQEALDEARSHIDTYFPLPAQKRGKEYVAKMEEAVIERSAQGTSVIFTQKSR
jgi:phage gp36-like protein